MTEILDPPQARIRQRNTILDLFPKRDRFRRKHIQSWIPSHREPGSGGKPYNPGPHHRETEHPKLSLQNSQLCLRCRCVVALFLCCWLSTSCAEAPCGENKRFTLHLGNKKSCSNSRSFQCASSTSFVRRADRMGSKHSIICFNTQLANC